MVPSGDERRASEESGGSRGSTLWVREVGGRSLWVLGRCGTSERDDEKEKRFLRGIRDVKSREKYTSIRK